MVNKRKIKKGGDNGDENVSKVDTGSNDENQTSPENTTGGKFDPNKLKNGINDIFVLGYKILTLIIIVIFIVLFFMSWVDVFKYIRNEANQENRINNTNMYISETNDYNVLNYLYTNSTKNEPYQVYEEEKIIYYMSKFVDVVIRLFFLQLGISICILIHDKINDIPMSIGDIPRPPLMLLLLISVCTAGAFALTAVYNKYYINDTRNVLININSSLQSIKTTIYEHLTQNNDFLTALTNGDNTTILALLSNSISNMKTLPGSSYDMIYTFSLYNYFTNNIPKSDPKYKDIQQFFTLDNIQNRTLNPYEYFYYKRTTFIENEYSTLLKNQKDSGRQPFFSDSNLDAESNFIDGLNMIFNTVNQSLVELQTIANGKIMLFKFMIIFASVTSIFIIFLIISTYLMYNEAFMYIWNKIKALFTKNKTVM